MKAVILAAGMASRLRPLTNNTPKCLLNIGSRPLLQRSMDNIMAAGIREFVIVTGYLHDMIENFVKDTYGDAVSVEYIYNKVYDTTNNIYSLWLARKAVDGEAFLLLDSDLLYDPLIVKKVLAEHADNVLTLIKHPLSEEEMKVVTTDEGDITEISKTCPPDKAAGESLGIEKFGAAYSRALYEELEAMMDKEHLEDRFYELAFERLIPKGHTFKVLDVTGLFSCELDTVEDFESAKEHIPSELY